MIGKLVLATTLLVVFCASAWTMFIHGGGTAAPTACTYNDSITGSCIPYTDTSNVVTAPVPYFGGFSSTFGFNSGTPYLLAQAGTGIGGPCPSYSGGQFSSDCFMTNQLKVCNTAGNIAANTHPWWTEGVVSWQAKSGPVFTPVERFPVTFSNGSATIGWSGWPSGQYIGSVVRLFTDGSLPSGFATNTHYYVVSAGTNTIQVAASPGGTAIVAGSAGSGTQTAQPSYTSVPAYLPYFGFQESAGTIGLGQQFSSSITGLYPAQMSGSVCGTNTNAYFVDKFFGEMPNIRSATSRMLSNDTLTIAAPPAGVPFWLSLDNSVGPIMGLEPNPQNLTVNCAPGAIVGYGNGTSKGAFLIENNGTTIDGCEVAWLTPSNSQAGFAWDAGLDLTLTNNRVRMAENGILRANIRSGITTLTNNVFESDGWQGEGAQGSLHGFYIGTVDGWNGFNGFDTVNIDNMYSVDTIGSGWSAKLRLPNVNITNSFFGCRVNSGACAPHAPIDMPCGGEQVATNSVFGRNAFSASSSDINLNQISFLVSSYEEGGLNSALATTWSGFSVGGGTSNGCNTKQYPASAAFTATITGPHTFTTTVDPATLYPYNYFGRSQLMWDLGVSGLMQQAPNINSWTGPSAGVYTVDVFCYAEGTRDQTEDQGSAGCFTGTGATTAYALNFLTILTNTPSSASVETVANPLLFGLHVGDSMTDFSNYSVITSITGSGPYTITLGSCTIFSGSNCLYPTGQAGSGAPSSLIFLEKGGPVQIDANTTGTSCDGHNVLCGITHTPVGMFLGQHLLAFGTDVNAGGNACFVAGKIASIQPLLGISGSGHVVGDTMPLVGGTTGSAASVQVASVAAGAVQSTLGGVPVFIASGTYNSGSGAVALTTQSAHGIAVGGLFKLYGMTGTGSIASLNDITYTATSGTTGSTLNFTAATGLTLTIANAATSGAITGVTMSAGGIYTKLAKTFTQGTSSGSGTGASFQFPFPQPVIGGSGSNYTITLAQYSGADCITGASSGNTYQFLTPSVTTYSDSIILWDGLHPAPTSDPTIFATQFVTGTSAWRTETVSNSLLFGDSINGGPGWTVTTGGTMGIGGTDGGGNVKCNYRGDTATSARCAVPPFTAASSLTGAITSGTLSVPGGASACKTGMYIWDTAQGAFDYGKPNFPLAGTRITSGGPTSFGLYIPLGGMSTTDITSRATLACGWGTPSSAFNGTISGTTLTVNSGLVGSIHAGDYLSDITTNLAAGTKIVSGSGSTWTITPSQNVSAEYMVSVR